MPTALRAPRVRLPLKHEQGWLRGATEIASYYGFQLIEAPRLARADAELLKLAELRQLPIEDRSNIIRLEHAAGALRHFMRLGESAASPSLLAFITPLRSGRNAFSLEALGSTKSLAEALLLKTANVILEEQGISMTVSINSLGDKDCAARFSRELGAFYRRRNQDLSEHCRELLKRDPLSVMGCKNKDCLTSSLRTEAPKPMSYLSEPSRRHFKETLEYMESLGLPYRLNDRLVGQPPWTGKTIFELHHDETLIGRGGRYDILGRAFGQKKEIPAVGLSLFFDTAPGEAAHMAERAPRVYFVQLGFEAKLHALEVVEILRRAHVPLAQAVIKEKLAAQLEAAEKLGIPYTIIMGQKEALDGTVIVRHAETRAQEVVPVHDLARYVKALK